MNFYVLDYLRSFSEVISVLFVGIGVLSIFQASRVITRQQRLHNTAQLLSPYYDNLVAPIQALKAVSADEFAQGVGAISPEKSNAYYQVLKYLNALEFVSTLINTGTVDERMASKLMRGTVG